MNKKIVHPRFLIEEMMLKSFRILIITHRWFIKSLNRVDNYQILQLQLIPQNNINSLFKSNQS